jgi:hypothetical protein
MNRIVDEFRRDDERVLDQLVDGELAEEDRSTLLKALDDEPGAWRRCALAFLEAQTWRGDFRKAMQPPQVTPSQAASRQESAAVKPTPAVSPAHSWKIFDWALALAASVFVAFGAGLWAHSAWTPAGTSPGRSQMLTANPVGPGVPTTTVDAASPWRMMNMKTRDPQTNEATDLHVPVVESENVNREWLSRQPSAIPPEVRQSLERDGHRILQQQRLVPLQLKDGRRVLVPVEQVEVQPHEKPAY